jgi:hypothetical protein
MNILQRHAKACPRCRWQDTRLSARRSWLEHFLTVFRIFPYRCRICGERFWRFTLKPSRQDEQSAPCLSSGEIQLPPGAELKDQKAPS